MINAGLKTDLVENPDLDLVIPKVDVPDPGYRVSLQGEGDVWLPFAQIPAGKRSPQPLVNQKP